MSRPGRSMLATGALLALAAAAPVAAQRLPAGTADCIEALRTAEAALAPGAAGPVLAGQYCDEYVFLLERSEFAALLPEGSATALDRRGLELLLALEAEFAAPPAARVDAAGVDAIVAGLEPFVTPPEPTLWQRIQDWIDSLTASAEGEPTWLAEWLERIRIPDSWVQPIMYGIAGLVVLTLLTVLINELRLGGAFVGRAGRRALDLAFAAAAGRQAEPPSFAAIGATPGFGRKTELLYALVVDRLRQRAPGRFAPGLTHREILRSGTALDPAARESLGRVAGAAERVTYASWEPGSADWESVLASGETLVRRLENETDPTA